MYKTHFRLEIGLTDDVVENMEQLSIKSFEFFSETTVLGFYQWLKVGELGISFTFQLIDRCVCR